MKKIIISAAAALIPLVLFTNCGSLGSAYTIVHEDAEETGTAEAGANETAAEPGTAAVQETTAAPTADPAEAVWQAEMDYKASTTLFDYQEFLRDPKYIGTKVYVEVTVAQTLNDKYRCLDSDYNEYLINDKRIDNGSLFNILTKDPLIVYGEYVGTTSMVRAVGNTTDDIFTIDAKYITLNDGSNRGNAEIPLPAEPETQAVTYGYDSSANTGAADDSEFIFPYSSEALITEYELSSLTAWEARIARNEIYARHGRIFTSADLAEYFNSKSWYYGTIPADQFDESVLNDFEKTNIQALKQVEDYLNGQS